MGSVKGELSWKQILTRENIFSTEIKVSQLAVLGGFVVLYYFICAARSYLLVLSSSPEKEMEKIP